MRYTFAVCYSALQFVAVKSCLDEMIHVYVYIFTHIYIYAIHVYSVLQSVAVCRGQELFKWNDTRLYVYIYLYTYMQIYAIHVYSVFVAVKSCWMKLYTFFPDHFGKYEVSTVGFVLAPTNLMKRTKFTTFSIEALLEGFNCVAVCCSVLQSFAVCWRVLQCVAVCCSVLQCVAVWCSQRNNWGAPRGLQWKS